MGKLIILKDKITGESIYPRTPAVTVISESGGSNILGYMESKVDDIEENMSISNSKIQTSLDNIKNLKNLTNSTIKNKNLSREVVHIQENKNSLDSLQEKNDILSENIKNTGVNKSIVTTETEVLQKTTEIINNKSCIKFDKTPQHSPNGRQVIIGEDGYLYVGVGGVWYRSIDSFSRL